MLRLLKRLYHVRIYTDGSYKNGKGGIGVFANQPGFHLQIGQSVYQPYLSSSICELLAIQKVLSIVYMDPEMTATILTDSQECIRLYQKEHITDPIYMSIKPRITFKKVKAHSGILGNDIADFLAKRARIN
jgi:ribonuclease HI